MKKFLSILLATMMVLAMVGTAFASSTQPTYTISAASDNGHTYEVLQIFYGDYADNKLSNAKWGKNGTGTTDTLVEESILTALKGVNASSDADKLAEIMKHVNSSEAAYATVTATTPATVPAGYYLIRDVIAQLPENETATLYVVEVADNITITPKGGEVEFKKQVKDENDSLSGETNNWQDSADYDIGDDVPFMLTGKVDSNYARYNKYYFCFKDTMESGLTSNVNGVDDITVKVDGVEITSGFAVKNATTTSFEVEFENLKDIASVVAGSSITVEYTAKLNDSAKVGSQGNMNKASLVYSNNPNLDQDGNPSDDKGETPEDAVIVFTYAVQVDKTNGSVPLSGAEFTLEKLNSDGKATTVSVQTINEGTSFYFKGLDDGNYRLTETKTPAGYNTIKPILFSVTAVHTEEVNMEDFTYAQRTDILTQLNGTKDATYTGEFSITFDKTTGTGTTTVVNLTGAELPSTGGIGTTLFYLFGGLMTAGSALMLVVRRRAEAEEE